MELHRGINFSRLEVPADAGGLIFVVGSVITLLLGVPSFRLFILGAAGAGAIVAVVLLEWHRLHQQRLSGDLASALHAAENPGGRHRG